MGTYFLSSAGALLTPAWIRKAAWLLTWKSCSRIWCELHAEAFARLGGVVQVVVLDNLKEGVLEPDVYDPALNPLYKDSPNHDLALQNLATSPSHGVHHRPSRAPRHWPDLIRSRLVAFEVFPEALSAAFT